MTSPVKRQREEDELQTTVVDGEQQAVDALAPVNKKGKGKAVEEPETNDASAAYDLVGSDYDEEEDGDYEVDLEAESDDESDDYDSEEDDEDAEFDEEESDEEAEAEEGDAAAEGQVQNEAAGESAEKPKAVVEDAAEAAAADAAKAVEE